MKFSTDKDVNQFIRQLTHAGWRFRRGGKHGKLMVPNSRMTLTVPCSPGDRRVIAGRCKTCGAMSGECWRCLRNAEDSHPTKEPKLPAAGRLCAAMQLHLQLSLRARFYRKPFNTVSAPCNSPASKSGMTTSLDLLCTLNLSRRK